MTRGFCKGYVQAHVLAAFLLCAGCAGSEVMPETAEALETVKESWQTVEDARVQLEGVTDLLCSDELQNAVAELREPCVKARYYLDLAAEGTAASAELINAAIEVYTAANDALKEAQ